MFEPVILVTALINGLMFGAIYALVALGLTLIYGVLHIINFAHGALLMLAMYAVYFLFTLTGIDPYLALILVIPCFYILGYLLYRGVIGKLAHGKDQNILLITLGLSVVIENAALFFFKADRMISCEKLHVRDVSTCGVCRRESLYLRSKTS